MFFKKLHQKLDANNALMKEVYRSIQELQMIQLEILHKFNDLDVMQSGENAANIMDNLQKLNLMINEFKGCVAITRSCLKESKKKEKK